ncbi:MAG: phenylacetate-CoA oxygenase subunit PaaC [Anaerolineales bacterium]|nr:phenylacetate-CoA oxygenase subunit PaaC [Anaerolineales bacterium]
MERAHQYALSGYLIALADDELILGHRDSEWTGHAPILEEDIAFANLALDEIGHAKLWYELAADLLGEDKTTYPDKLVYFREPAQFRNMQLVELPKGDWAFSTLRQYLFDAFEALRLEALSQSSYTPLAEIAARIRTEELYHLRHSQAWVPRLGLGTQDSPHAGRAGCLVAVCAGAGRAAARRAGSARRRHRAQQRSAVRTLERGGEPVFDRSWLAGRSPITTLGSGSYLALAALRRAHP